uniref:SMB domain-containing protein n=2 Tax=Steinernema glaseri TaxID=37863 RepID=A0A1I7ZHL7_9BILA
MWSSVVSSSIFLAAVCLLCRETQAKDGGTSIAGSMVTCFNTLHDCNEFCYFECNAVDHCNDSDNEMVACAPDVTSIVVVTLASILGVTILCCLACFCSPCCLIAMCISKRRDAQQRNRRFRSEDSKANSSLI